jgi:hypothetical protein
LPFARERGSRHPSQPGTESRIVALIELGEGIRRVSNLRDVALREPALGIIQAICNRESGKPPGR